MTDEERSRKRKERCGEGLEIGIPKKKGAKVASKRLFALFNGDENVGTIDEDVFRCPGDIDLVLKISEHEFRKANERRPIPVVVSPGENSGVLALLGFDDDKVMIRLLLSGRAVVHTDLVSVDLWNRSLECVTEVVETGIDEMREVIPAGGGMPGLEIVGIKTKDSMWAKFEINIVPADAPGFNLLQKVVYYTSEELDNNPTLKVIRVFHIEEEDE